MRVTDSAFNTKARPWRTHCNRPAALDCAYESICERCGFFETGPQFVEIIQRQRDHAANNDQHDRAQLYAQLLTDIDNTS